MRRTQMHGYTEDKDADGSDGVDAVDEKSA
jgi:hypothetical protein